ncbi:peptidyl-tRNA hydrolase ICT1, putative [Plasmodium knowlesi strain H]|uniref:Peptidyl-tRNA hydrolase ICT1, putative n=2 Tax=Plasmodium knowlesi TaxID=5850 RepID=B3L4X9_PLAKH|nr:peptidyl-tRNA hydrolase ICT1, putative [Plasmodium knowlesi strain H]OTN65073.1 Uncharacterized protein PKNOH_S120134100 [Plasmodium knowlesi]CAA9988200.1 peptidyl-tRNA hydrolase ICT1, putative [Plasmodium knowlesi strain H]VVS77674.1 peptidyl-tRNA hydrolase ICT1, putative [Plasmodium knowlesi strain H]|eukprot:XP_002259177.1 hypothetical protein, conserved in Plasmodium species [Plasmodium knowlesi strain H]
MFSLSRKLGLSFEIPFSQIQKVTARSSGPGGQSVNKAESKVQLRFNVDTAKWIPSTVKDNLKKIHKNKLNKNNELIIECEETPSQISNYKICTDKLRALLEEAENYKEKTKHTSVKDFIHLIKTDEQIKRYKDALIEGKKKRRERKFNKRDYD